MPAATPIGIRREIVRRREEGESYASMARDMGMPYITVRKVDQHYRKTGRLEPNYERCRPPVVRKQLQIYEQAVAMKQTHPSWGAGLIWVELKEQWQENDLPSVRTLQRWFQRAGVAQPAGEGVSKSAVRRGQRAHEVWALDAKEAIRLADGSYVSWLTVSDEGSGAVLGAALFPHQALGEHRATESTDGAATDIGTMGQTGTTTHG